LTKDSLKCTNGTQTLVKAISEPLNYIYNALPSVLGQRRNYAKQEQLHLFSFHSVNLTF